MENPKFRVYYTVDPVCKSETRIMVDMVSKTIWGGYTVAADGSVHGEFAADYEWVNDDNGGYVSKIKS